MKTIFALLVLLSGFQTFAAVDGLSISNAHIVTDTGSSLIIRGKAPANQKQFQELLNLGVTDFLIFKIDTKGEVAKEQTLLQKLGVPAESITHVAFPWKDVDNFQDACAMTITAMQTIEQAAVHGRSLYFHCTVGEDRTGYLAGLWGLWNQTYVSATDSLKNEMCERGYEAGNPGKPYKEVVLKIRETLTPTYLKMAKILMDAKQRGQTLSPSLCDSEPQVNVVPFLHYCK